MPHLTQERLWKMTTARQVAYLAAAAGRTRLAKQLDKITPKSAREAAKAATLSSFTSKWPYRRNMLVVRGQMQTKFAEPFVCKTRSPVGVIPNTFANAAPHRG